MKCSQGARPCQCLMFKSILPKKGCVVEPEPPSCSYFMIRVECASWCNEPRYFHFKVVSVQLLSLVLAGLGRFVLFCFSWCFWSGRSLLVKAVLLEPHKCADQQKPLSNHASLSVGWWPYLLDRVPSCCPSLLIFFQRLHYRGFSIPEFLCVNKSFLWHLGTALLICSHNSSWSRLWHSEPVLLSVKVRF